MCVYNIDGMNLTDLTIATEFRGAARLGILAMSGIKVTESPGELKQMVTALADDFAKKYQSAALGEEMEESFRRAAEHQCVRPVVTRRCSIVRA